MVKAAIVDVVNVYQWRLSLRDSIMKSGAMAFLAEPIGGRAGEVFKDTFERGTLLSRIKTEFADGRFSRVGTEMPSLEGSASSSQSFSKMRGSVGSTSL